MKWLKTQLPGVWCIDPPVFTDLRGQFVKTFSRSLFQQQGIAADYPESFYSVSQTDVIRGMHFQLPPADIAKLVTVLQGRIVDVVLDLRQSSPTYGQYIEIPLSAAQPRLVYVPVGCAHGFKSLVDNSMVMYYCSGEFDPEKDGGIRWDSFGYDWQVNKPVISEKDRALPPLAQFRSPW